MSKRTEFTGRDYNPAFFIKGLFVIVLLQSINSPEDLKKLPEEKLPVLAAEIRHKIIEVVGKNGGHLASNLGAVELTIALHRVFNSPNDAIVWDVSHQCYTHKLLTGRYRQFDSIRTKGGISGFTRISESPHDFFDAGHASSSISSALGLLTAWNCEGRNDKVIAVIGDGALTGGMAYEALNHAGQIAKNLVVIVNDNQMSISRNTGSISRYLSRLTMTTSYQRFRYKFDRLVDRIPYISNHLGKVIFRLKRGLKGLLLTNNLFVDLGFEYVGPLNGHNIEQMEMMFRRVKKIPRPVVVHVVTRKGKGYSPAENDPSAFHGVGPFNISDGIVEKYDTFGFTEAFSQTMLSLGAQNTKVVAVTAAMAKGTGLAAFSRHYPDRFFDVGIAEEHAVTFAGGLAAGGMIPVVAIYSTFLQRAIDQVIEDLALQKRHVVIAIDRAGAVPADGETHQGIFDIALLRAVPNLSILTASSARDLEKCIFWAVSEAKGPVAIRWPKMSCPSEIDSFSKPVQPGRGLLLHCDEYASAISARLYDEMDAVSKKQKKVKNDSNHSSILMVCTGGMYSEVLTASRSMLLAGVVTDIYALRFIKPFDESYFLSIVRQYNSVVFIEDGVENGGISKTLVELIHSNERTRKMNTTVLAFPDAFLANGTRSQILEEAGISSDRIAMVALDSLNERKAKVQ